MIQKVLKKTRRSKDGQICESRSYYLRFRFDPMPKDRWISLKTTDKQVALKKGQELMQEMQMRDALMGGVKQPNLRLDAAGVVFLAGDPFPGNTE